MGESGTLTTEVLPDSGGEVINIYLFPEEESY